MAYKPVIDDHKRGDYWGGVIFGYEEETDSGLVGIDLTGAVIVAEFRASQGEAVDFMYSTEDGSITLVPNFPWKCEFAKGIINHEPNTYYFELKITFPDGVVDTIVSSTWTIFDRMK